MCTMVKKVFFLLVISLVLSTFLLPACGGGEERGFGIFLVDTGELILSEKHIKAYHGGTHEIELNEEGMKKWNSYIPPDAKLGGPYTKDFVIKIGEEEIYRGKFWSLVSSSSYAGVVILDALGVFGNKLLIEFGYPSSYNCTEKDPRDNPQIISYFEKQGLLK